MGLNGFKLYKKE